MAPGDNEVSLTVRIRHHRRFRPDRTLGAEVHGSGIGIDSGAKFECRNGNSIKVFGEVMLHRTFGTTKLKSERVQVSCSD